MSFAPNFDEKLSMSTAFLNETNTASDSYAKRRAEFLEKLQKKLKETNTNYLQRMLSGMTTNCSNIWNTKYALNDIEKLKFHLGCNPNCDSSIYAQIASLKAQEPILQAKLKEFETDKDKNDGYNLKLDDGSAKNSLNHTV